MASTSDSKGRRQTVPVLKKDNLVSLVRQSLAKLTNRQWLRLKYDFIDYATEFKLSMVSEDVIHFPASTVVTQLGLPEKSSQKTVISEDQVLECLGNVVPFICQR